MAAALAGFGCDWPSVYVESPSGFSSKLVHLSDWKPPHSASAQSFHNSVITQNVRNLMCTTQDKASIMEDGVNLGCGHVWTHSDS